MPLLSVSSPSNNSLLVDLLFTLTFLSPLLEL